MRGAKGEEQRGAAAEEILEEEAEAEDVERARAEQRDSVDGEDVQMEEEEDVDFGAGNQDVDFGAEQPEMETPFDVQDDFGQVEYKADDLDEGSVASDQSDRSSFSLGAVNDLEKELYQLDDGDDQPRQELGDELVSHTSKWHKHTVRVFGMLKKNMKSHNADEDDAEEMEKESQLSYNKLVSGGCSRRTASGVFFEMLQLKTWDFIELNQDKSYGDIAITPGIRFDEAPPSS